MVLSSWTCLSYCHLLCLFKCNKRFRTHYANNLANLCPESERKFIEKWIICKLKPPRQIAVFCCFQRENQLTSGLHFTYLCFQASQPLPWWLPFPYFFFLSVLSLILNQYLIFCLFLFWSMCFHNKDKRFCFVIIWQDYK